ncbi:ZIP family metal transporter [Candidatus Woesearchaeota archaeon]|nr:ZIP family metal transporter [Candidatus Woesearchaeota archaeon]
MEQIIIILIITVLGPIVGSAIGVLKKPSKIFMYNMLSFAAGVMLSISFLNLIPESIAISSILVCVIGVFIGAVIMYSLDKLIPHIHPELCSQEQGKSLKKTSIYLIFGIFLHNFPEGMAIAAGTISDISISFTIALAIAIHNIPEGICTSAPYYNVTKKKLKSFLVSSSTAIPLLVGFGFAYFLYQTISSNVMGLLIGATAGLMIYISSDELIPSSCCRSTNHSTIFSLIIGVLFVILLGVF